MKTRSGRTPRLGQHFLTNADVARSVADGAHVDSMSTVLEVGPGTGALTKILLERGARVVAIEKDPTLVTTLKHTFSNEIHSAQLTLIEGDIRDTDLATLELERGTYVVAANIPYYITGEIIRFFLTNEIHPAHMSLLIQKEVADRIVARNHKESILSVSVKVFGSPRIIRKVPPGNFSPPPSVDSAVIAIENISHDTLHNLDEQRFFNIVRAGFSSKRKILSRNLRQVFEDPMPILVACAISPHTRAEDLSVADWLALARTDSRH